MAHVRELANRPTRQTYPNADRTRKFPTTALAGIVGEACSITVQGGGKRRPVISRVRNDRMFPTLTIVSLAT
jgi:hypothetical protein